MDTLGIIASMVGGTDGGTVEKIHTVTAVGITAYTLHAIVCTIGKRVGPTVVGGCEHHQLAICIVQLEGGMELSLCLLLVAPHHTITIGRKDGGKVLSG